MTFPSLARRASWPLLTLTLLSACSDSLSGGGAFVEIRSLGVVGPNGDANAPLIRSTGPDNGRFELNWDVRSNTGTGMPLYGVQFFLVSLTGSNAGDSVEFFFRNCDVGINTGCRQGANRFFCDFRPGSGGTEVLCPAGEGPLGNGQGRNLSDLFSRSVGLPGTYGLRMTACTGFPQVCETRQVNVRVE